MKNFAKIAAFTLLLAACSTQTSTDTDTDTPSMGKRAAMVWTSEQTGTGEFDMPENDITLTVESTGEELYSTTCNGTTSTEVMDVEGSVATIQCWWAGGGDQYGVFVGDAEELTVRHRTVDEEAGFGEWMDLETL
jgi:hypothetical protein